MAELDKEKTKKELDKEEAARKAAKTSLDQTEDALGNPSDYPEDQELKDQEEFEKSPGLKDNPDEDVPQEELDKIAAAKAPNTSNDVSGGAESISTDKSPIEEPEDSSLKSEADQGLGSNTPEEEAALNSESDEERMPASIDDKENIAKASPSNYYSDLMQRLHAAQQKSNILQAANDAGRALYGGATSYRGVQQNPNFTKMFDVGDQEAQMPMKRFEQELAIEEQDPNAPAAEGFKQLLSKQFGINLDTFKNMSIAQMKMAAPFIEKPWETYAKGKLALDRTQLTEGGKNTRQADKISSTENMFGRKQNETERHNQSIEDIARQRLTAHGNSDQQKSFARVKTKLDQVRGATLQAEKDLMAVNKADELVSPYKNNPDALTNPQFNLLAMELAKAATGGVPTHEELKGLNVNTIPSGIQQLAQKMFGKPTPAERGEFVKQFIDYMHGIKKVQQKVIVDSYGRAIETEKPHLSPTDYDNLKDNYVNRFLNNYDYTAPNYKSTSQAPTAAQIKTTEYDGSTKLPANATSEQKAKRLQYLQSKAQQ